MQFASVETEKETYIDAIVKLKNQHTKKTRLLGETLTELDGLKLPIRN